MSVQQNIEIAQRFLERVGSNAAADTISVMFSENLVWNVPGAPGMLPWIGQQAGRVAVKNFLRDFDALMERVKLEVHDVTASESRAVIVGELATRIKATGKVIETPYFISLTIAGGVITHFMLLENTLAVVEAAQP